MFLGEALEFNAILRSLDMSINKYEWIGSNFIGDKGGKHILNGLINNTKLHSMNFGNTKPYYR